MNPIESVRENLDYVASSVRRNERAPGEAAIYFLWAVLVPIGFALPDFAPRLAGPYWFVAGIGGGILSWWLGSRGAQRRGLNDRGLGRRYGWHWLVAGIGFLLAGVPMFIGAVDPAVGASLFLLVGGVVYLLAAVHLERGIAPSGVVMLVAYVALLLWHLPYVWTTAGLAIGFALAWGGWWAMRSESRTRQ